MNDNTNNVDLLSVGTKLRETGPLYSELYENLNYKM